MPPISAKGMFRMISTACFTELNELKSRRKIAAMVIGHNDGEPLHRALLVLKLAAPRHDVAGRQLHRGVDFLLSPPATKLPMSRSGHVAFDDDAALPHLAADLRRAFA